MGAGGALLEVSGLPPAGAAVFRAALPAPGSEETPAVALDTAAPAGGEVVEWLVDDENLAVRGALGLPAYATRVAHGTAGLARLQAWMHVAARVCVCTWLQVPSSSNARPSNSCSCCARKSRPSSQDPLVPSMPARLLSHQAV